MVARRAEIEERKDLVLGYAVGQYIKTVTPVSSSFISKKTPLNVSSATVRNIFAELEDEGFLTHPHTSAGRIPTEKGYRYYVDHLMNEIQLLEQEKERIREEYIRKRFELENLLERTSRILSKTTQYTSIISIDGESRLFYQGTSFIPQYFEVENLQRIRNLLAALEEKEQLLEVINRDLNKKIDILIGNEIACQEVDGCSLVLSRYKTKGGSSGRIAVLGPTRMEYDRVVSALEYFSELMEEML
jgi:transcriptional regulator of heat shock response